MKVSSTLSLYHVPYNGVVSILNVYLNGRLRSRTCSWYDSRHSEMVVDSVDAPLKVSKANLLKAICWMGTSIKGRSNERLEREASRPGDFQIMPIDIQRYNWDRPAGEA